MAINELPGELSAVITPDQFPPSAAALIAARMLNRHSPGEIAQAIEVLIDVLDMVGGDPDLEEDGDNEPRSADGDTLDITYPEWTSLRHQERGKINRPMPHEDDEQDDFDEDSFDQEAVDEREIDEDFERPAVAVIWPGEGRIEVPLCKQ